MKPGKIDLLILFLLALLIRFLAALPQQQPNYMDAAYSYVNALNLAAGRGFVEDFVWNYLAEPGLPPQPSHLYWMPLTSILAWLGMIIGGPTYRAAQVPFVVLAAALAPITYAITYLVSGQRWQSWLAGLFMIFSGFYVPFWTAIDNFAPFGVAGSLALLAAWWGITRGERNSGPGRKNVERRIKGRPRQHANPIGDPGLRAQEQSNPPITDYPLSHGPLIASGAFIGLAHLARADGPLLLVAVILFALLHLNRTLRAIPEALRVTLHLVRITVYVFLGYFVVMLPWFVRNWLVIGSLLPSSGSQTMWLTSYDDLFRYGRTLSAHTFLAQGIGPVFQGRWWALTTNLQTVLAVWGMIFLLPLAVVGAWKLRHHGLIRLAVLYALLLYIAMTLIFAFPGARGGLFHSGTALLPFFYAGAVVGLDCAVDWAAARRRGWHAPRAKQFFAAGLLFLAVILSGFIYHRRVLKDDAWNTADALYPAVAAWVAHQDPRSIVMIGNPPAYRFHGGGLSVVVPNDDIDVTLKAARQYQVDYLVLDSNRPAPLAEVYNQTITHPGLSLVKTFVEGKGNEVHVFKILRSR